MIQVRQARHASGWEQRRHNRLRLARLSRREAHARSLDVHVLARGADVVVSAARRLEWEALLRHRTWTAEERLHLILRDEALVGHAIATFGGVGCRLRWHVGSERAPGEVLAGAHDAVGVLPRRSFLYLLTVKMDFHPKDYQHML